MCRGCHACCPGKVRILTSGQTPKIGAGGSKMDIVVLVAVGDKELVARRNIPRRAEIDPALDLVRKRQRNTDRCKVQPTPVCTEQREKREIRKTLKQRTLTCLTSKILPHMGVGIHSRCTLQVRIRLHETMRQHLQYTSNFSRLAWACASECNEKKYKLVWDSARDPEGAE
jgi:hypothetical protein